MKNRDWKELLKDAMYGMLAGAAGTYVMDKITGLLYARESDEVKKKETALMKEPAYNLLARKIAGRAAIPLTDSGAAKAGSVFHWSYGIVSGGSTRMLREGVPVFKSSRIAFRSRVFAVGDEAVNTALELSSPPKEFPWLCICAVLSATSSMRLTPMPHTVY